MPRSNIKSFTLVELLIVIAILAVLAAAVVIVLNPAELLAQARDTQRITDLKTVKDAVDIFIVDNPTASLGTAQKVYLSLPDTSSTCATYTLPTLPAGWTYNCVTSANLRNTNGTGWIPLDFSSIKGGSPMPYLPIDPTNDAVSGRYYTYTMGGYYELTALMEAQKSFATIKDGGPFVELYEVGTNVSLLPVSRDSSLVGYWTFDGSGSITNGQTTYLTDSSGKGNNGTASNANGTGMSFTAGTENNAAQFDGVDDYVNAGTDASLNQTQELTVSLWLKYIGGASTYAGAIARRTSVVSGYSIRMNKNNLKPILQTSTSGVDTDYSWNTSMQLNTWQHIAFTYSVKSGRVITYLNGNLDKDFARQGDLAGGGDSFLIGKYSSTYFFDGAIDEVRVYNRALSATEIKSLYDATK